MALEKFKYTPRDYYDYLDVSPRSVQPPASTQRRHYEENLHETQLPFYNNDGSATVKIEKLLMESSRIPNPLYDGTDRLRLRPDIQARLNEKIYLPKQIRHFLGKKRAKNLASLSYDENAPVAQQKKESPLIDQVLQERTTAFQKSQELHLQKLKELNEQRDQLVEARGEVKRRLQVLTNKPSTPPFSDNGDDDDYDEGYNEGKTEKDTKKFDEEEERSTSAESVHSVGSIIRRIRLDIPRQNYKFHQLRELHAREMKRLKKLNEPYRGELSINTYEPWQLHDYDLVRGIVEDVIDSFLDTYFKPAITTESKQAQLAQLEADKRETIAQRKALQNERMVQLLSEELLLHATREIAMEACKEFLYITSMATHMSNLLVMRQAEYVTTDIPMGREPDDPLYPVITNGFFLSNNDRNRLRKEVYAHTQHLTYLPVDDDEEELVADDDQDAELISYDQVIPVELVDNDAHPYDTQNEKIQKEHLDRYRTKELQYWVKMTGRAYDINVNPAAKGISYVSTSPSSRYLAVGTIKGDFVIYDLHKQPWQPLRVYKEVGAATTATAIVDISWSLDETQITSINDKGLLNVWAFQSGLYIDQSTPKKPTKDDLGSRVAVPLLQISMDYNKQAFVFSAGPFSEIRVHDELFAPKMALFHTCLTLMGLQRNICVVLENGDVLKCEMEKRLHAATDGFTESTRILHENLRTSIPSHIGADVETELFRAHKFPIINIGFIRHTGHMFTLDNKGFLFVWRYSTLDITEYGWMRPFKKYRFDLTKVMFEPEEMAKPNIIFSDKVSSKTRTRQEIAQERKIAQESLDRAHLIYPWHQEYVADRDLMTIIYRPEEQITESGVLFHVVVKHYSTNQLATYITRVYKPLRVKCTRFFGSRQSTDGKQLVFLLLFPTHLPKRSHLAIVKLNLETFEMMDFRKDIFLSDTEYELIRTRAIVHWQISSCYGPTGAQYLFLNKNGDLTAYSLNTGLKVLKIVNPKQRAQDVGYVGCRLNSQVVQLLANHRMRLLATNGKMQLVYFNQESTALHVLDLVDPNDDSERRTMWKTYQSWEKSQVTSPQYRITLNETYLGDEVEHSHVFCRNIVMKIIDFVIEYKEGPFTPAQREAHEEIDQTENYRSLLKQTRLDSPTRSSVVTEQPPLPTGQSSRQPSPAQGQGQPSPNVSGNSRQASPAQQRSSPIR